MQSAVLADVVLLLLLLLLLFSPMEEVMYLAELTEVEHTRTKEEEKMNLQMLYDIEFGSEISFLIVE